jgi:hypothetical protein
MSEQAGKVRNQAIPEWAEGLYYNKGLFEEAVVYHDDKAIYFEVRGKDSGVVRFTFEMIESLQKLTEAHADSPE